METHASMTCALGRPRSLEFNYKCGAAPPRTPLLFWGAPPAGPPKRRSAPLAAVVVRFLAIEPLVRAAALPGVELFSQKSDFCEQATCPGQLRCLGQNSFSKIGLCFEQATCPGQLRCLRQNLFLKITFFEPTTCPGQLRCLGQNVFS